MMTVIGVGVAAGTLSGCGSSTSPSDGLSDQQISTDLAATAAPAVANATLTFVEAGGASGADAGSVVPSITSCTVHSAGGLTTFTAESHPDSITFSRTWEYFSDAGCENAFDSAATDSIAFTASLVEVDHDPRFDARATEQWTLDVTGAPTLAAATTHVWNGVGTGADTAEHQTPGLDRTYLGASYDTAADIVFPNPRNGATTPSSATVSRWTTVTVTQATHGVHKARTISRHMITTFNGTAHVPLVVLDESSGARLLTCTVDLIARRIIDGSCH